MFSDGFPETGDGGDGYFERISRTCAESALRRLRALDFLASWPARGFIGAVAEFHVRLDSVVSDAMRRSVRWPKAPNSLGSRMATNLRAAGVEL